jgi:hypothetical protein
VLKISLSILFRNKKLKKRKGRKRGMIWVNIVHNKKILDGFSYA